MKQKLKFSSSFQKQKHSFKVAFHAISWLFQHEGHFKFHTFFALLVIVVAFVLQLSSLQFLFILLAMSLVFITEAINTAIEILADKVDSSYCDQIKKVKDIAAAAVLIATIFAIIIGLMIFIPVVKQFI